MSENSSSRRSQSQEKKATQKIFVTNLVGTANEQELESQLRELFDRYGKVDSLVIKRSRNNEYSFGFVVYQSGADAEEAIRNLNNREVRGKPMKVESQDDSKRRKDPDKGCYTCGKKGHFARECRSRNESSRGYNRRSYSRSRSDDRRKHRHRKYSQSSEEERSRHKKSKKHRSKDRDEKKKKKHKKHRHRSSSRSYS